MTPAATALEVVGPDGWREWRAIRLRCLRADPDAFGSSADAEGEQPEQWWRDRLAAQRAVLARLVEVPGPAPTGPVGMGASYAEEPGWRTVVAMWVEPRFRGCGVGTRVLEDVVAAALATGDRVRLWVADGNPARSLYERAGFVEDGTRSPLRPGSPLWKSRLVLPR